ncbi:MAG: Acyl-CoA reductase (LuxC) [Candidatus Methanofastidiosum methylothiophilum]|uniref:Acyl-CoA reductase (LuxC) n=1 Tax=Candidatus Methanofastidiosum methylothiophilum TaxID=1705564 RepID=A0A150ILE4_9EURY|nr:MAG: Acyl-CoA reductase (LuxC) [Candidatus Methanofastidiosum methylthiophilus]KYC48088.1 MAG: Acyl-CoA reductase (LuxC) [Candidatus Methanofastidiosum methylthiophilus]KYC49494.1 MAG: Acyl-CoA reductase (LuxC) [Candidatus Methanofastidiosum methylthiophilus]
MSQLKGYYLPKSLKSIEKEMDFSEKKVNGHKLILPVINQDNIKDIVTGLKENRKKYLADMPFSEIARTYGEVSRTWSDNNYEKKKIALELLPLLTNLSPELIEFYQFRSIYKINEKTINFLSNLNLPPEVFKNFTPIEGTNTFVRAYAGFRDKIALKRISQYTQELELVTYITPSNVPGFIESLGIFIASIVKASGLIKTPSVQPLFAPLYAESVSEKSKEIGETIAVVPWAGGDQSIEDVIFRNSNVVSVVSSTQTAMSVKNRVDELNAGGNTIKGCYHGGKFGVELIGREMANTDVAGLAAIDGIGYEGYMCGSPAFGFFVEEGGELSPIEFAEALASEMEKISRSIPQTNFFRKLREVKIGEILSRPEFDGGQKIFSSSEHNFAVIYESNFNLNPIGQNRLIRVFGVKSLEDVIERMKPWKDYLQTAGVAIGNNRLQKLSELMGKTGFSNIRVAGTVALPRLGEAWDGNYPVYEFFIPDKIHWTSINAIDFENEIKELTKIKNEVIKGGVFNPSLKVR